MCIRDSTFTFPQYAGYTLNADTAGKHIEWGGTVEVKAVYSQIHAESVKMCIRDRPWRASWPATRR